MSRFNQRPAGLLLTGALTLTAPALIADKAPDQEARLL